MMQEKDKKDILLFLYILIVLVLGVIYFTVPERANFFEFQLEWWREMWQVITGD